ncbi:hypothetical protein BpHYR1_002439 [Brachionus plicatilis]|uniref:Uncharacterized protein n=1 Tax=Brachionus plicatilis TaxID=10195 RepID=A0A3M7QWW3_BRAPC|nr:hypothetical protein BpHYR1_002439 [Brachionus plicatilis]
MVKYREYTKIYVKYAKKEKERFWVSLFRTNKNLFSVERGFPFLITSLLSKSEYLFGKNINYPSLFVK